MDPDNPVTYNWNMCDKQTGLERLQFNIVLARDWNYLQIFSLDDVRLKVPEA